LAACSNLDLKGTGTTCVDYYGEYADSGTLYTRTCKQRDFLTKHLISECKQGSASAACDVLAVAPSTDTPLTPQSVEVEKPIGKAASSSIVQAPPKVSAPSNKGRIGPAAPLIAPLEVSAPDTIEPAAPYSIAQAPLKVSAPSKKSEISNGAASSIAQAPLKVTALPSTQTKKWPIASSPKPSRPTWEDWPKNYDDCKLCICEARIPSTFNPVRWPSSKTTQALDLRYVKYTLSACELRGCRETEHNDKDALQRFGESLHLQVSLCNYYKQEEQKAKRSFDEATRSFDDRKRQAKRSFDDRERHRSNLDMHTAVGVHATCEPKDGGGKEGFCVCQSKKTVDKCKDSGKTKSNEMMSCSKCHVSYCEKDGTNNGCKS